MKNHKQSFRRLVCLLLCAAMLASFGVTALAAETSEA